MPAIKTPRKPFPNYKWRWASYQPTEGLNSPPVFLGVLRVFRALEGTSPSSPELAKALEIVKKETKTRVDLVRTPERNLIRNSGQYWKALDLIEDRSGRIILTDFGRRVADGLITKSEFAATVIKMCKLPNYNIEDDVTEWEKAGLRIKPFELILSILVRLSNETKKEAFLTKTELISIIIPLAGDKATLDQYIQAILAFRAGKLDLSDWPDCAPGANDERMAREFLLFLDHYGYCRKIASSEVGERFYLAEIEIEEIHKLLALEVKAATYQTAITTVRASELPSEIERQRVYREITVRPGQPQFRKKILAQFCGKCLVTSNTLDAVLEAAHIIPVQRQIIDTKDNGFCLRSDIHLLYDSGHLRMDPAGNLFLSEAAKSNYKDLPGSVMIPAFVNKVYVEWRWKYY